MLPGPGPLLCAGDPGKKSSDSHHARNASAAPKETCRSTGGNPVCWPTSPWLRATPPRPLQAGPGNTQKQRQADTTTTAKRAAGATEVNTERAPAPAATPGSASARRAGRPRTGDSGNARKSRQTPAGSRSSALRAEEQAGPGFAATAATVLRRLSRVSLFWGEGCRNRCSCCRGPLLVPVCWRSRTAALD